MRKRTRQLHQFSPTTTTHLLLHLRGCPVQHPDLVKESNSDSDSYDNESKSDSPRPIAACPQAVVVSSKPTPTQYPIPRPNYITKNDITNAPARNTRSQASINSVMGKFMLSCVQFAPKTLKIDPCQAASRRYPLQLWCEMDGAVLDQETGDLLEYQHLAKHPRLKRTWQKLLPFLTIPSQSFVRF